MTKAANSLARTTPPVRVSFPNVFEKRAAMQGGTPSYSVRLMIDKTNKEQMAFMKELHADMKYVQENQWPDPATRSRIPLVGHDKSPIKDGDKACNSQGIPYKEKNPELEGHYFLNAASYSDSPLVVVDERRQEILDKSKIYGGCWCKINMNVYARTRSDNPGISFGLNGVQKWGDDEALGGGRPSAENMFEAGDGRDDPSAYGGGADPFAGSSPAYPDDDIPF